MFLTGDSLSPAMTAGEERMETPGDVAVMLRLAELGWGSKRIAFELGCSRTTVKRYLRQGGWASYRGRGRPSALAGLEGWLAERFRRQAGEREPPVKNISPPSSKEVSFHVVRGSVCRVARQACPRSSRRRTIRPPRQASGAPRGQRRDSRQAQRTRKS